MKFYIRSHSDNKIILKKQINLDVVYQITSTNIEIATSQHYFDPDLFSKELLEDTILKYEAFLESVVLLIMSHGFHDVEPPKKAINPIQNTMCSALRTIM